MGIDLMDVDLAAAGLLKMAATAGTQAATFVRRIPFGTPVQSTDKSIPVKTFKS